MVRLKKLTPAHEVLSSRILIKPQKSGILYPISTSRDHLDWLLAFLTSLFEFNDCFIRQIGVICLESSGISAG